MQVDRDFYRALAIVDHGEFGDALLPTRLAMTVKQLLVVDGASINLTHEGVRVPLGASDEPSRRAESLEFTAGEGPCLTAIDAGIVIQAPEPTLTQRWPALAELWFAETPFRSATSRPLLPSGGDSAVGSALNLFFRQPSGGADLDMHRVDALATIVTGELFSNLIDDGAADDLLRSVDRGRRTVWTAVGIVMNRFDLSSTDALARLRGYAYANATTVDDLAVRLEATPRLADELEL